MKSWVFRVRVDKLESLLTRGAWIEINCRGSVGNLQSGRSSPEERGLKYKEAFYKNQVTESLLTRGAWIEIKLFIENPKHDPSLLTRGAWIEIKLTR